MIVDTGSEIDMGRAAVALRCFADFIACRPSLPKLAEIRLAWFYPDGCWSLSGQLHHPVTVDALTVWSNALDDAVITARALSPRTVQHEVSGTIHGHLIAVWLHEYVGGNA
ncbi:hypothetical protein LO772_18310 [Yinghuangia sp. ASG 101]|uniref:hypothetical protein n=1 Tax=Yinghuangia sp. ASG 101 TaxID=2896848 RepID=UPI001E33A2FD|nr:hypothetical protein [Yinghuangia sp. ASG 101]UGQ08936.1 hypothetical protein LO772_18310 [Yinghuangia sp. ASG 101]